MWISTSFEDLCDQNVIVYLLRVKAKEYMPQVGIQTSWMPCPQQEMLALPNPCQHPDVKPGSKTQFGSHLLMPSPVDPAGGRPVLHELLVQGVLGLQLNTGHCAPPLLVVALNICL